MQEIKINMWCSNILLVIERREIGRKLEEDEELELDFEIGTINAFFQTEGKVHVEMKIRDKGREMECAVLCSI